MSKLKLAYFLLAGSTLMLIINIYNLDFNDLKNGNYFGIIYNILLILGMIINIKDLKK
jgi:hypothetical protein